MRPSAVSYFLTWKGIQTGPFSLEQIRAQLAAGEISRMHRVGVNGGWHLLDEFLATAPDLAADRRQAELAQQEQRLRREFETQLAAERTRDILPPPREEESERSSLAHFIPKPPPPPILPPELRPPEAQVGSVATTRTSGLAIAALVMALCNFIPYVGFFSWILALVFGHTALGQMQRDPHLGGRGMAIGGLVITYFLLVMGLTFVALVVFNQQKLPDLFRL